MIRLCSVQQALSALSLPLCTAAHRHGCAVARPVCAAGIRPHRPCIARPLFRVSFNGRATPFTRPGSPSTTSAIDPGPLPLLYPCPHLQVHPSGLAPTSSSPLLWLSEPPTGQPPSSSVALPLIHAPLTKWLLPQRQRRPLCLLQPPQRQPQVPLPNLPALPPQRLPLRALPQVSRSI